MIQLACSPPEDFLEEETRCEYFISKQMKEVWAVELDLTQKLLEVCKKYNLKIFADWGTALGTVRHKGFIPWDDDMDFTMFRDDYEKLRKIAQTEFKYPYHFYAAEDVDGSLLCGSAKFRDSRTTAIGADDRKRNLKCNQGIFIDIFPLDNIPDNKFAFAVQKRIARIFVVLACGFAFFSTRYFEPSNIFIRYPAKILHKLFRKPSEKLMKICYSFFLKTVQKYNGKNSKKVAPLGFRLDAKPRYRDYFEKIVEMPFEYISLPMAQAYDASLKTLYGDYMVFKKNTSFHEGTFYDPNHPYTDYLEA